MWQLADEVLDDFLAPGKGEFIKGFASPFTLLVIADLLGIPPEDRNAFVDGMAERLGVTTRHLHRAFVENIGVGPKEFARSVRLQRALRLAATSRDWGRIASDAGYYDQSHLIADFRDLAFQADIEPVRAVPDLFQLRPVDLRVSINPVGNTSRGVGGPCAVERRVGGDGNVHRCLAGGFVSGLLVALIAECQTDSP